MFFVKILLDQHGFRSNVYDIEDHPMVALTCYAWLPTLLCFVILWSKFIARGYG